MLYIPNIRYHLKILTEDEVKDFSAVNFREYFNYTREKLYSKLSKKRNLGKVPESLYIFLATTDEVEKRAKIMHSNSSDKKVHRYNIEALNLLIL